MMATKLNAQVIIKNLQNMHEKSLPPTGARRRMELAYQDWARLQGRGPRTGGPFDRTIGTLKAQNLELGKDVITEIARYATAFGAGLLPAHTYYVGSGSWLVPVIKARLTDTAAVPPCRPVCIGSVRESVPPREGY